MIAFVGFIWNLAPPTVVHFLVCDCLPTMIAHASFLCFISKVNIVNLATCSSFQTIISMHKLGGTHTLDVIMVVGFCFHSCYYFGTSWSNSCNCGCLKSLGRCLTGRTLSYLAFYKNSGLIVLIVYILGVVASIWLIKDKINSKMSLTFWVY